MFQGRLRIPVVLAIALTVQVLVPGGPAGATGGAADVVIDAVYPDTYVSREPDEFVRLANRGTSEADLSGWTLGDGEGTLTFPAGAIMPAGAHWTITGVAEDFRRDNVGVEPDWEYDGADPTVPDLAESGRFSLANGGDEVFLHDADGLLVDVFVYGASTYDGDGWNGPPVPKDSEGVIHERDRPEDGGMVPDTGTAADWDDLRRRFVGQSDFGLESFTFNGRVTAFTSPDSSYETLAALFNGSTRSIDITIYEMTNVHLGRILIERAEAGIDVRLLLEGGPVGFGEEERHQQNWLLERLVAAGGDVRFMITDDAQDIHDRYRFVHAKYGVIDGDTVFALSGNFKYSGVPVDPSTGNREWGVVVENADVARYLLDVFEDDFDAAHRDILPFGTGTNWRYLPPPPDFEPDASVPRGDYEAPYPAKTVTGTFTVTPILTPDTSLLQTKGLIRAMETARDRVLIEQMYAHKHWGPSATGTPETDPNHYLEAAIRAARTNDAFVYALLGEEFIDLSDTRNNNETKNYLNGLRADEGIPTHGRIVDQRIANLTKIHNKGVVIDGRLSLVSSINWGVGSARDNRELALLIDNEEVGAFFEDVFWYDWEPRVRQPPADLVLTDLVVEDVDPVAEPLSDPFGKRVHVTVENRGGYAAEGFDVVVDATPSEAGGTRILGALTVESLGPRESVTITLDWATLGSLGEYRVTATADPADTVYEVTEDNNHAATTTHVLVEGPGVDAGGAIGPL